MKILIYGHKGWIGQQFVEILKTEQMKNNEEESISFYLASSRVDNIDEMLKELDNIQPTHVISFIGRTHGEIDGKVYSTIDYLEQSGKLKENVRDNLFSPLSLALACKNRGIHYTYLGTGCIFSYIKDQEHIGFTENSLPNFTGSGYSTVKGFTDMLMHQLEDCVLNLRIRMPIVREDNPRNFITKIVNYENICSISNSMTVLPELLPFIINFMRKGVKGTLNLTNPGTISHNEILEMYKEYVDPEFTWQNFSIEEQNKILASERSNNLLDTTRLEQLEPSVKHIKDSVRELLQNYKSHPEFLTKKAINKIEKSEDLKGNFIDSAETILFVTGGAGFIGSNFINELFKSYNNIKVINFDALYYCANENNVEESVRNNSNYTFIHGNLQSYDLLKYIFQNNKITHVIHFAAQSHVQTSFTDSLQYTKDNILGTHNLLEVARLFCPQLQKFIHVSTDEVYGESMLESDELHKTEQSVLCPTNPYAATKAAAELIAQSYNHSFKMPIIITRGNNVYGPNQYPEKVIPRFIQQLQRDEKVTIQGNGSCVRAFLHAYDTASAFIIILEKGNVGEIYNIGCDEGMEYSILEVAKILIKKIKNTDNYEQYITFIEDRPFNDQRYYISNQKLKNLGWKIKISFEEGLDKLL
jgi:dTDP-glucose 4,6-dehydratase